MNPYKIYRTVTAGVLALGTAAGCAAWFSVFGGRISHERLVYALSSSVPEWTSWDYAGTRCATETLPGVIAWALAVVWAAALATAGHTTDKRLRPVLLLAAFFGTVACIGAGDIPMAVCAGAGASVAAGLLRRFAPEGRRATKVAATGLVAAGLAITGVCVAWPATFPNVRFPFAFLTAAGLGAVVISRRIFRSGKCAPGVATGLAAALVAGAIYPGTRPEGFVASWKTRYREVAGFAGAKLLRPELSRELFDYRPTPAEAAAARLPRAEAGTDRTRLPRLLALAAGRPEVRLWLLGDDALHAPRTSSGRIEAIRAALTGSEKIAGPAAAEMRGWLLLEDAREADALRAFDTAGDTPQARLGAGIVAARLGDNARAVAALVRWCRLSPRAVFSPAWEREPLASLKTETLRRWKKETLATGDKRAARFVVWSDAWERSGGAIQKFLEDPENTAPVVPAVKLFRSRLLSTLRQPDDAKIGAIFSAGVAMFTDRHVNLGQCHRLFAACAGGDKARTIPDRILISRPAMPGWPPAPTEGGAGSSLRDFEENLLVRLVTYGM